MKTGELKPIGLLSLSEFFKMFLSDEEPKVEITDDRLKETTPYLKELMNKYRTEPIKIEGRNKAIKKIRGASFETAKQPERKIQEKNKEQNNEEKDKIQEI